MKNLPIGTKITFEGNQYTVVGYGAGTYVLEQVVMVFGEPRSFREMWKQSWIDANARIVK